MNLEAYPPFQLLKATQVAQILNVSRAFAYQLMKKGELPTVKMQGAVRVKLEDLRRYIEAKRTAMV